MAASDPTSSVPTPTGTLQGVAAFSWDGTTWQPAGLSMASVATPTGVLRGVAPFTYSGGAWQPSGRARPGVPTPTGTLDGVALYTWSGIAWTPAGGAPDVPTPSGTLQGIAAFYWDGANWQPTGQAAPEVATPSGVLQGMAMFSLSGGTWVPTVSPASLDLNFVTMTTLDPSITFTRASTATYVNSTGVMQTAAVNAARLDYNPQTLIGNGLLIEETRVNQIFPSVPDTTNWTSGAATVTVNSALAPDGTTSATLVAETVASAMHYAIRSPVATTSVGPQILSLYAKSAGTQYIQISLDDSGSGTIGGFATFDLQAGVVSGALTARGGASIGAAVIQAAGNGFYRCSISVTTTGASLNDRVLLILSNAASPAFGPSYVGNPANGVLIWGAQIEVGAFPTSYIPTTAATVTRAVETASLALGGWFNSTTSTWCQEGLRQYAAANAVNIAFEVDNGSTSSRYITYFDNALNATFNYSGGVSPGVISPGVIWKIAERIANGAQAACLNGGALVSLTSALIAGMTTARFNSADTNQPYSGYIRRLRYWPQTLSNSQMQQVTT